MVTPMKEIGTEIRRVLKVVLGLWTLGVYNYANGDKYEGEVKEKVKNGKGKSKFNRIGVLSYANGDIYSGDWKDNLKNGEGIVGKWRIRNL